MSLSDLLTSPRPVTWLFAGDSITHGTTHLNGHRDYAQHFRERMGEKGRNEDVIINTAIGGWSIRALSERLEERVLRFKPDAVFIMYGTNDAVGGEEGIGAFVETYLQVINRIREAGIGHIIVQTTVPMWPVNADAVIAINQYASDEIRQAKLNGFRARLKWISAYVEATRKIAQKANVMLVDHSRPWEAAGGLRGGLLDGGFHPNEFGHRFIAHTLFRACGLWDDKSWTCRLFVPVNNT